MRRSVLTLLLCFAGLSAVYGADFGKVVRIDRTVHDFGKVRMKDGALECSFTVTNIGEEPMYILTVVSTCSCTGIEWTQTEIKPGESGTIKASYNNQDGPYPFDKTIKVYFSNYNKPVALHLKGVVGK